jgi:predicted MFS family arabinose efflux permease
VKPVLFSKAYRAWLLTILLLTNALNLADRQGIAVIAQAIKLDLKLTDAQMGVIQGLGFAIFYTLLGLPLARMAERMSRARIIAASLAIFGVMVSLCGSAQSFWRLLLFRVGVGVGDAGFGPPVASLIGDHYPRDRRASAMSIIWLGAPLGVVAGSTFAGWMAENVSWRAAFVGIGAPALIVALIAFLTLRDPPRGMSDEIATSSGPPPSMWEVLRFLLSKHSVRHTLIGCALAATAMNAIGQFLGQFFVRVYHMGFADAGRLLGLIAALAMSSGLALGGFGVDWASRFDQRWFVWGPAIGLVLATPLFAIAFAAPVVAVGIGVLIAAHVVLFIYFTPTLAIAQNMVSANMRASSAFVVSVVLGLVGIGLGPTLIGVLSDAFAGRAFAMGDFETSCPGGAAALSAASALQQACSDASSLGIRHALIAVSMLFAWAGIHYLMAARNLRRDLEMHYRGRAALGSARG